MMYDTLRLSSPSMDDGTAHRLIDRLRGVHEATCDASHGRVLERFLRGSLVGRDGVSATVEIRWKRPRVIPPTPIDALRSAGTGRKPRSKTVRATCPPYVILDGSVHKLLMGHNVYGGPTEFAPAARAFLGEIQSLSGMSLPDATLWEVHRVDAADVFELPPAAISDFLAAAGCCRFSRRKVEGYGRESVECFGETTTAKAYHKGPEMVATHSGKKRRKHVEAVRLGRFRPNAEVQDIMDRADRTLRIETTIKARKLRDALFLKRNPLVGEIHDELIEAIHRGEVFRLLGEGRFDMEPVVRRPDTVAERLEEAYSSRQARSLMATWAMLVEDGEPAARAAMKQSTFADHLTKLRAAGCAWLGAHRDPGRCTVPEGFAVTPSDPRYRGEEAPPVRDALAPYRQRYEMTTRPLGSRDPKGLSIGPSTTNPTWMPARPRAMATSGAHCGELREPLSRLF